MKNDDSWITGALIVIAVAVAILHASLVYGDWTCAIARCVKAKP